MMAEKKQNPVVSVAKWVGQTVAGAVVAVVVTDALKKGDEKKDDKKPS